MSRKETEAGAVGNREFGTRSSELEEGNGELGARSLELGADESSPSASSDFSSMISNKRSAAPTARCKRVYKDASVPIGPLTTVTAKKNPSRDPAVNEPVRT